MANTYCDYPARIAKARNAKGLSQEALAEMIDISPRHLGNIERGIANPSVDIIYHISTALDVPLSVLLGQDQYVSEMTGTALRALVIEAVREALAER